MKKFKVVRWKPRNQRRPHAVECGWQRARTLPGDPKSQTVRTRHHPGSAKKGQSRKRWTLPIPAYPWAFPDHDVQLTSTCLSDFLHFSVMHTQNQRVKSSSLDETRGGPPTRDLRPNRCNRGPSLKFQKAESALFGTRYRRVRALHTQSNVQRRA